LSLAEAGHRTLQTLELTRSTAAQRRHTGLPGPQRRIRDGKQFN
jgi:hypothetical protein